MVERRDVGAELGRTRAPHGILDVPASPGRPPGARPRGVARARRAGCQRIEQDRADRRVIEQAAAELRSGAIRAGYAGEEHKHVAFALAMVLDELARHVRDLRPEVRVQVVCGARMLLGETIPP